MLAKGDGTHQNMFKAYKYFLMASDNGNKKVMSFVKTHF